MKQSGRKQAMTNTFTRLLTQPEEYVPETKVAHFGLVDNCELCGAALDYSFKLMHPHDPDFKEGKSLRVGSDCIFNFLETYVPNLSRQLLINIKNAVESSKKGQFQKNNPFLFENMKEVKSVLYTYSKIYGGLFFRLKEVDNFIKSYKLISRKNYLSKPQISNFILFKEKIESKKLEDLLKNHIEIKSNNNVLFINDTKFFKFYNKYKEKIRFWNDPLYMYSNLEKQLYKERVDQYKKITFKKNNEHKKT